MKRIFQLLLIAVLLHLTSERIFAQSPYKISWEKDGCLVGVGGAAALGGYFLDHSVSALSLTDMNQLSRESINGFDQSATYSYSESAGSASDILRDVLAVTPFLLVADKSIQDDWCTIGIMYAEVAAYVAGTNLALKGSVQRIRPFVYNPDAPLQDKLTADARKSFFSGHTTIAFASAVFLSTVYSDYHPHSEWNPYIWASSLVTAGVVGYLRYESGQHYPTDIITGAIVGSAIGYIIPWMHRVGKDEVSVTPIAPHADYGFSLQLKF